MTPDRREQDRRNSIGLTQTQATSAVAWGWKIAVVVAGLTTAWTALGAKVDDKLDTARFERDSVRRENRDIRISHDLDLLVCAQYPSDTRCPRR